MKVRAKVRFRDMEADKIREPGATFTVTNERYKKLAIVGFVEPVTKGNGQAEGESSETEENVKGK